MAAEVRYSIAELAQRAGVSRRTVRFYVQRGLIPPPHGRGRGRHYGDEHLEAVLRVQALKEDGHRLDEIGRMDTTGRRARPRGGANRDAPGRAAVGPAPVRARGVAPGRAWYRQTVAPGYELHVAHDREPLNEAQLARVARLLGTIFEDER